MDEDAVEIAMKYLKDAIEILQMNRPIERGEDARKWSIVITELEKVNAVAGYFLGAHNG